MSRIAASVVMWVGRATVFVVGLAVIVAIPIGLTSAASGGDFILGQANSADDPTILVGRIADRTKSALVLRNPEGGSALQLQVDAGKAPLKVNATAGKARHLDADKLDGQDASAFLGVDQKAADTELLDGKDSSAFVQGGGRFIINRTDVIVPAASVDVLAVPGVGKLSATCGAGGDSFTLTYTNQFENSQQQVADQRSQNGTEATAGTVIVSGGVKSYSFSGDGIANEGHWLSLQVAPSAQASPGTVAVTTFEVSAFTQAGGQNTCRFQGLAIVQ